MTIMKKKLRKFRRSISTLLKKRLFLNLKKTSSKRKLMIFRIILINTNKKSKSKSMLV